MAGNHVRAPTVIRFGGERGEPPDQQSPVQPGHLANPRSTGQGPSSPGARVLISSSSPQRVKISQEL